MNANRECSNESSNGFWNRKISIWHFVYIVLICSIFIIGTLLIMPGRVNQAAYENFSEYVGVQSRYCEGLLDGIATFCSDKLRIEQGSRSTRKKVAVYDEQTFGSVDDLKTKVAAMPKLSKGLLTSIDEYYSDKNNQNAPDSV